uniref:Anthocyanin regulatory C1 protein n=1 Tax=Zea mays TaxID=4577 RepID=B6U2U4_MAIZE|nr:anthocyanin regulatory C1 protein [Zea mays]|eukprot:NP_001151654.1 anthocyanin regulatory C1 protein [Zea mays]
MVRKPIHADDAGAKSTEASKERKGLWSPEEDERLFTHITYHVVSTWSSVAQLAGLRRSGKSCRLRWLNYLRPDLKKEPISKREEETIISLQQSLGNRWSTIAARMPGRTDNEIKNYWNSRIRKRLNAAASRAAGCGDGGDSAAEPSGAAAAGGKEDSANAAPPPAAQPTPIPARFPVFGCQLPDGAGGGISSPGSGKSPQSSTTASMRQNAGDESDASDGGGGDSDMVHFLSFDDLDYPGDLLIDVPGAMDAWESQLCYANPMMSSLC